MRLFSQKGMKIFDQHDNIWIRLVKAKYLKNNYIDFLRVKKSCSGIKCLEDDSFYRELLKKCIKWISESGKIINVW